MKPKPGTNAAGAMRWWRAGRQADAADDGREIAALAFDAGIPMPMKRPGGSSGAIAVRSRRRAGGFESELGERWPDTVVVVATEFGRTRASTAPRYRSRHGTIALLAGGAVKGGRVISDCRA